MGRRETGRRSNILFHPPGGVSNEMEDSGELDQGTMRRLSGGAGQRASARVEALVEGAIVSTPLRVLILYDRPDDAELMAIALRQAG